MIWGLTGTIDLDERLRCLLPRSRDQADSAVAIMAAARGFRSSGIGSGVDDQEPVSALQPCLRLYRPRARRRSRVTLIVTLLRYIQRLIPLPFPSSAYVLCRRIFLILSPVRELHRYITVTSNPISPSR